MKCIDTIEGATKAVLEEIFQIFVEDKQDDTEYIRMVKAVLTGTDRFAHANQEITTEPEMLTKVLYEFAKSLWLRHLEKEKDREERLEEDEMPVEDEGYAEYYFDYIYNYGTYPR